MEDTITVQDTSNVPATPMIDSSSSWSSIIPMVLIFVVFYFLLIRPQEKRRKAKEALVLGVKKGESVVTSAGIFGTVTSINDSDNTVMLQIAPGVEIKIRKGTIEDITSRTTTAIDNVKDEKSTNVNKDHNTSKKIGAKEPKIAKKDTLKK